MIIAIYPYVLVPTTYQPREASAVWHGSFDPDITTSGLVVAAVQVERVLTVQGYCFWVSCCCNAR